MPEAFLVYVDLDPIPGQFHSPDDAAQTLQQILKDRIPHYNPLVVHAPVSVQPYKKTERDTKA